MNANLLATRYARCRLFDLWLTWDVVKGSDGRKTYIIAFAPTKKYSGTHHKVTGTHKKIKADSVGVHIVRELTGATCEWTRAQQVDLKFLVMPSGVLDFLAKQHLGWADDMQVRYVEIIRIKKFLKYRGEERVDEGGMDIMRSESK